MCPAWTDFAWGLGPIVGLDGVVELIDVFDDPSMLVVDDIDAGVQVTGPVQLCHGFAPASEILCFVSESVVGGTAFCLICGKHGRIATVFHVPGARDRWRRDCNFAICSADRLPVVPSDGINDFQILDVNVKVFAYFCS